MKHRARSRCLGAAGLFASACGGRTALSVAEPGDAGARDVSSLDAGTELLDAGRDSGAVTRASAIGAGRTLDCAAFDGRVFCWGYQDALGNPAGLLPNPTVVHGLPPVTQLAGGQDVTCALTQAGDVSCWGLSWCGSLAFDDATPSGPAVLFPPRAIPGGPYKKVSYTGQWGCAITEAGAVGCWGGSSGGIATNGGPAICVTPPSEIPGLSEIVDVGVGIGHACAVRTDGALFCWGSDEYGQIGNTYYEGCHDLTVCTEPVARVEGVTAASGVAAGESHSCALESGGTVVCWGRNDSGQLGTGVVDTAVHVAPASVSLPTVTKLSASVDNTCARTTDGHLYCWGANASGQIGNGTTSVSVPTPSRVPLEGVVDVAVSYTHACALDTAGRVWCWGDEDSISRPSLVPVQRALQPGR